MKSSVAVLCAALALAPSASSSQETPEPAPPFITTPPEVVAGMLRLAGTGPNDTVIDLGSGDGRIVIAAARDFGARSLGLEIDSRLVARSRDNAVRAGVAGRVGFEERDVLVADLSGATVITMYLLPGLIDKLQPRFLAQLRPGTRIVSHAFPMIGWKPDRVETLRLKAPHPGQGDESRLFLWVVPAQVRGDWRAPGAAGEWRVRIEQNFQEIELEGTLGGRPVKFEQATLAGTRIGWRADGRTFHGRFEGGRIVGMLDAGAPAPLEFRRVP